MDYKLQNKYRASILTYIKGGKPIRTYGRNMTDDFAREFLKNGSEAQLAERRKMFVSIPKAEVKSESKAERKTESKQITLQTLSRKELDEYAKLKGLDPNKYSNKAKLIKALK